MSCLLVIPLQGDLPGSSCLGDLTWIWDLSLLAALAATFLLGGGLVQVSFKKEFRLNCFIQGNGLLTAFPTGDLCSKLGVSVLWVMLLTALGCEVLKIFLKSLGDHRECDVSSSRTLALSSSFLEAVSSACFLKNTTTCCLLKAEDSCSYAV